MRRPLVGDLRAIVISAFVAGCTGTVGAHGGSGASGTGNSGSGVGGASGSGAGVNGTGGTGAGASGTAGTGASGTGVTGTAGSGAGGTGVAGRGGSGPGGTGSGVAGSFGVDGGLPSVVVAVQPLTANLSPGGTQQFSATVTGASDTSVTWSASGGTITSAGLYTAPQNGGSYVVRATSVADSRGSGTALATVSGGASVVEPFYDATHPYVQVMTPIPFVTYFAPATIRIWAHAPDYGSDAVNGYSPHVDFYLGTQMVGSVNKGTSDPIDYYEVDATNVAAGSYEVYVRSKMASGTVESMHVPITVIDVPAHGGPNMNLTSDVVLSGSTNFELIGTPTARALLTSSNGSRIRSASGWTGHLTIRNADIVGLGGMDIPGIEVTVAGSNALEISGSVFDRCGPPSLTANDKAAVTISGNTFQPNILTSVNDQADYAGSHPSVYIAGSSTASKLFQGNNVGVSYVRFDRSSHWLIGGDHDADGNVIIGVRAGIEFDQVSDITMRGNIQYHRYPFGWSQGHNVDCEGSSATMLLEHNVFRGSSWMIQSVTGEFRYNLLIDNINEAFIRFNDPSTPIHHNVFINVGYQRSYYPSGGLTYVDGSFYNNTVDMGGAKLGWFSGSFIGLAGGQHTLSSARNNVFTGFAYTGSTAVFDTGTATSADYNAFYNPDTTTLKRYADSGLGAHDIAGGASTDPKFSQARVVPFPIGDGDIWLRHVTVSQILSLYRGIYAPAAGSPLIDAGAPSDDTGGTRNTDVGAVGAGNAHPADQFGRFGP